MLLRLVGMRNSLAAEKIQPGDLLADGRTIATLTTVGAGTITAAMIASGILNRSGPTGAFSDTMDTTDNILAALKGNFPTVDIQPGLSFEFLYINSVAYAMTLVVGDTGTVLNASAGVSTLAASLVRTYLLTVLNATKATNQYCGTTSSSKVVTFDTPIPIGTSDLSGTKGYGTITPGMTISGTGVTGGTKVVGLTYGQGTITGFTTDTNLTATTASGVAIAFTPSILVTGLFSTTA